MVLEDVGKDDLARLKLSEEKGALVKEVRDSPSSLGFLADGTLDALGRGPLGERVLEV